MLLIICTKFSSNLGFK